MKETDEWETPQDFFNELHKEFRFNFDLCAAANNKKCDSYAVDALNLDTQTCLRYYRGDPSQMRIFMNPPYSNPTPFVDKAIEFSKSGAKVVMLLKCDTSTKLFHKLKDMGAEIRFIKGRLKFERGGKSIGPAPFPSMVVVL